MTSHFAANTTRRNTPAWCKPGMFTHVPPVIDGRPTALNAYARWTDIYGTDELNLIETIHLSRTTLFDGWLGASAQTGYNLQVQIHEHPNKTTYNLELYARLHAIVLDDVKWIHHQPLDDPRFDTGPLSIVWIAGVYFAEIRVMG